jgi:hypothetical protein
MRRKKAYIIDRFKGKGTEEEKRLKRREFRLYMANLCRPFLKG